MTARRDSHAPFAEAQLSMRFVAKITGELFVPRYQRGYRWGKAEVDQLLDDLYESEGKPYCLQPIVVKRRADDRWELVDGQQRLTTLYLIVRFMQREGLQKLGPQYTLTYETRSGSQAFLHEPVADQRDTNIDFFHIYAAYEAIRAWFDAKGDEHGMVANDIYRYLFKTVQVIWYEASPSLDSTTLFTRLNVGRIPLTDAELVKALLLSKSRQLTVGGVVQDRSKEIAAQWDAIERDLHDEDVWGFVSDEPGEAVPTRITLLLDALAPPFKGKKRPRFHTFEHLRDAIQDDPIGFWNRVLGLHALVLGWFENRTHYHKIGYLVAAGLGFASVVRLAEGETKSGFEKTLDAHIRDSLSLSPSDVMTLSYENDAHKNKCMRLLLLMNVETVRRLKGSTERYPFRLTRGRSWSLEHIHAQNAESLTKGEQWKEWLEQHRKALVALSGLDEVRRAALLARIDAVLGQAIERAAFFDLAREVTAAFSQDGGGAAVAAHALHSISNLALLSTDDNAALNNAVFEVKRQKILALDKTGAYIPICTRQVFLKYFTGADAQQVHFWSLQDRESYLDAMIGPAGVVTPYLKEEKRP